jgi:hypothetical protein
MIGLPSRSGPDEGFDAYDEFRPTHVPDPGSFLDGHDVLTGTAHASFHRLTRALFEERGVYDVTFGYNLARLNLDRRHPDAGFRYAVDADDPDVLRAEFTPTTEFCPQSDALTVGAFRAWNGEADKHEFDEVRVRVDEMHQESLQINGKLAQLEGQLEADGELPDAGGQDDGERSTERSDVPF